MTDNTVVIFYKVAPKTEIGRVTFTSTGELVPEGVGHVYLNTWKLSDRPSSEFVEYYTDWSNGHVQSQADKASLHAEN